jgi:hypothetical protein
VADVGTVVLASRRLPAVAAGDVETAAEGCARRRPEAVTAADVVVTVAVAAVEATVAAVDAAAVEVAAAVTRLFSS